VYTDKPSHRKAQKLSHQGCPEPTKKATTTLKTPKPTKSPSHAVQYSVLKVKELIEKGQIKF
jgi:hypothetical protein